MVTVKRVNNDSNKKRNKLILLLKIAIVAWTVVSMVLNFVITPEHFEAHESDNHDILKHEVPANPIHAQGEPMKVAYAVSFIKCGDFQTHAAGLVDASLVLRHSIHRISSRNPESGSKYDYKMYAIVHKQAEECSGQIRNMGFEVVVVDQPMDRSEIKGDYLRKHIQREWCCGESEFIKLFAYTLPEEIIVHVDIDFAFYKPMDHLFDAILYDKDSEEGKKARSMLELERPGERLPDKIGAFLTKDWPQVAPGKFPAAYQAGFLVARRDPSVMEEALNVVREGNYTDGWGYGTGWHGSGHGGYVGAMAMQGLIAYYYDFVRKDAVELNQCRYNHMGMDVLYRTHPNFNPRRLKDKVGKCRNGLEYCEDCHVTDFDKIYSVHYTMCRKPWQCISETSESGRNSKGQKGRAIPVPMMNKDHCYELIHHWHDLRSDFEKKLFALTGDTTILEGSKYEHMKDIFHGHCKEEGNEGYAVITAKNETLYRIHELYEVKQ